MSERGVFAVDRGIFNDPDFANEPFTEREAFMWLISEAAWKDHRKRTDGKVIELKRGQLCHSVRFMAEAWQWSKSRVDRFLDRLENRDMIKRDRGTRTPVVTICKYDQFQRVSLPDRDNSGTTTGTSVGQQRDKLEDIENKEIDSSSLRSEESTRALAKASSTPRSELLSVLDQSRADAVLDHRQRIRKPLTAHAAKLLAGKFARCSDPNAAADAMIANGWQGFEPEWLESRSVPRGQPPPREPDLADLFNRRAEMGRLAEDYDDGRTIETSYEHRDFDRPGQAVPRLAAAKGFSG